MVAGSLFLKLVDFVVGLFKTVFGQKSCLPSSVMGGCSSRLVLLICDFLSKLIETNPVCSSNLVKSAISPARRSLPDAIDVVSDCNERN